MCRCVGTYTNSDHVVATGIRDVTSELVYCFKRSKLYERYIDALLAPDRYTITHTIHGTISTLVLHSILPDTIHDRVSTHNTTMYYTRHKTLHGLSPQHYTVLYPTQYQTQYTARSVITTLHCIVPNTIPHTIHGTTKVLTTLLCIILDTIHRTVCNHSTTLLYPTQYHTQYMAR